MTTKKFSVMNFSRVRNFTSKYRYGIGCSLLIVILWGVSAAAAMNHFEQARIASAATEQKKIAQADEDIKRIKSENETKLKLEEEKKAKDAADAEAQKKIEEGVGKETGSSNSVGGAGCNTASAHTNPNSIDVLVNKKHCLSPVSFTPPDLVTTHGATISAKAADDFNRMFAAAASAGQPFTVSSSYRSYDTQVSTYNYWVSQNGQQEADTVSARPGYSEHQTGLAMDVAAEGCSLNCFGGTSQYQWFQANAASYGFIQRYYSGHEATTGYSSEEWHYRYVGVAVAQDMKARGIKTLEEYWGIEGGDYR